MNLKLWIVLGMLTSTGYSAYSMAHPELSYQINGIRYYPQADGTLTDEYEGEPYVDGNPGKRARYYQGGSGSARGMLRAGEYLFLQEVDPGADFIFESMGSTAAVRGILSRQLDWGVIGRELFDGEKADGLVSVPVAYDAVFVAVPKDFAPEVQSITVAQLAAVFVGEITSWKDLGGPDLPLVPVGFSELSGNWGMFREMVLERVYGDDGRYRGDMKALLLDLDLANAVMKSPGALAFGSFSSQIPLELAKVRILKVEGEELSSETVATGRYPLVRPLNFVTLGEATGPAKDFLDILLDTQVQAALKILKLESAE